MYVSGSSAFYKTTAARRRHVRLEITQSMYTVYIHIAATRTFATQHNTHDQYAYVTSVMIRSILT